MAIYESKADSVAFRGAREIASRQLTSVKNISISKANETKIVLRNSSTEIKGGTRGKHSGKTSLQSK